MGALYESGLTLFAAADEAGGSAPHHGTSWLGLMVYLAFTLLVLFTLLGIAKAGMKERVFKNKWTGRFEQVYLFIEGMILNIIGPQGRKYTPFIITLWLVIFVSNAVALFFSSAPTADLGFNLAMALISIGYVQWEGIMSHARPMMAQGRDPVTSWGIGFFRHISHFTGPRLGGILLLINGMIFVIELVSEMMKNVSLSLRLFGNINGGHQAVEAMNQLGVHIGGQTWLNVPIGAFLILIKLLTVVVQALIFTLLTCVYISLVTHHEDDHGHESEAHGHELPVTA